MAFVSRAEPGASDPEQWREGAKRAREARKQVAEQVAATLQSADLTGSRSYLGMRLRNVAEAEQAGDPFVLRGALVDLAAAAGAWAADVDLRGPVLVAHVNGTTTPNGSPNGNGNGHR